MFQRNRINVAVASVVAATVAGTAQAEIEEVVVTATKRTASTQDIPIAVQALGEQALEQQGITNFEDYLIALPGVTAGGSGPGQNTIYIRGLASTTPNLTTAGVAGLAPNVALYLDEQPLAQPGRNLDVYAADLNRVEVLSGPQGTLFGASSQAGTVRLITNKPDPSGTYGKVKLGTGFIKDGEQSTNVEAMINIPMTDRLTVRGVVYVDNKGGYIDNVAGTLAVSESGRFRSAGTVRQNGVPVSAQRQGFQAGADLSAVNFIEADNATIAEDDFNETTYAGGRLSVGYAINESWNLNVTHMQQSLDSEGVFFSDPTLGDYEITRFSKDSLEDEFSNTSWTLDGIVGDLELVYTGAFTDRDTDQLVDYSDYMFVGQYLPYYVCDSSVTYPADGVAPAGTCQAPDLFVTSSTDTEVWTHEIRLNTPVERSLRATVGAFYSDLELVEVNDFTYPGSTQADVFGSLGFFPNFPMAPQDASRPGPFPDGVIFRNDVTRTDEQFGVFGEATLDLGEHFAVIAGARYYDIEVDFVGSANSSFCNSFAPDSDKFGTNISDQYDGDGEYTYRGTVGTDVCAPLVTFTLDDTLADIQAAGLTEAQAQAAFNAVRAPDSAQTDGVIGKFSLQWTPNNDQLWYLTWSEGFRPGLLNRPGGATNGEGFTVPFALDTDEVVNYELGWKLDLFDYSLRLNGNLFYVEIENLQTTIFDPSITNLFFSDNAADAEIRGLEGDFIYNPPGLEGLTITGAFSFLDTEITDVITPTEDVVEGDELAFAPEFQANIRARYEWALDNGLRAHVMPSVSYSDEAFSDVVTINRDKMDSWALVNLTAGVSSDLWTAELFVDNVFDEAAELTRNFVFDRQRVTLAPPRTMGVRLSYDF